MNSLITFIPVILILVLFSSCKSDSSKKVESVKSNDVAELIRNPQTLRGNSDTTQVPQMTFEQDVIYFDTIVAGTEITETFKFINTGQTPLWISDARSTCGCTVPEFPKEPIPPGEGGEIKVRFNTTNKYYHQDRPISIFANTYPGRTVVRLRGYVVPDDESEI